MHKVKIKQSFIKTVKIFLGCLFVLLSPLSLVSSNIYADPVDEPVYVQEKTESEDKESEETEQDEKQSKEKQDSEDSSETDNSQNCQKSLNSLGWLICPGTGVLSQAVDWIYDKIEEILIINPISMDDGSPIYEIWKYFRGITNIVFCIFLLIVIYSQLTGFGISNYGVKKALPKLIIAAILVNLSFIICSVCVDVSNIIGNSIRELFISVEEATIANSSIEIADVSFSGVFAAIAGGAAVGAFVFDPSLIWMIIPVVLGAIVAVVSGLITVALRQAVVILLIMVSPLAFVALILPNTEPLFKKWKQLLYKMLIFYPAFGLLFGASNLAGWAIIVSAKDGFAVLLGLAVQVFPLFFSWKLMRMSGTFLEGINSAIRRVADKPLAVNRSWASSHRELSRQKYLANSKMPSARLNRFLLNRRIARELETGEYANSNKTRGTAYRAAQNYTKKGQISKKGKQSYDLQSRTLSYQRFIAADQNNFNRGLSDIPDEYTKYIAEQRRDLLKGKNAFSGKIIRASYKEQLANLDVKNVEAVFDLKAELTRGAKIEYDNTKGLYSLTNDAINAHMDKININNPNYEQHDIADRAFAEKRYNSILKIMEGEVKDVHFVGADNAYSFNSQAQVVQGKFQKYFNLGLPSADINRRLQEFTLRKDVSNNIDAVISGLSILNQYGDTDTVKNRLYEIFEDADGTKKIDLGTYASQSIASFCMFGVKDSDPILRRFGKYINVETARIYNEGNPQKRRHNSKVTYNEYINGEYDEYDVDDNGNVLNTTHTAHPKYSAADLLQGTSFKGMERTAIANMTESIRNASYDVDKDGNKIFNIDKFKSTQEKIWEAIMPNIIGDQFAFLSGSEQIKALAKGITGVDINKHSFDWDGIFGKELAASLTDEQKKDYIQFLNKRTKTFLGGHVPNQIARTKSDMLGAVMNLFTMSSAIDDGETSIASNDRITGDQYKKYEAKYGDKADDILINSLSPETLKGFLKMWHKGYQGDTKANLTKHLHAEELYKKYFGNPNQQNQKNNKRYNQQEDDEDGAIANNDNDANFNDIDATINSSEIEKIYMSDQTGDARVFYAEIINYLNNNHLSSTAREFEIYYHNNPTASRADLFTYLKSLR